MPVGRRVSVGLPSFPLARSPRVASASGMRRCYCCCCYAQSHTQFSVLGFFSWSVHNITSFPPRSLGSLMSFLPGLSPTPTPAPGTCTFDVSYGMSFAAGLAPASGLHQAHQHGSTLQDPGPPHQEHTKAIDLDAVSIAKVIALDASPRAKAFTTFADTTGVVVCCLQAPAPFSSAPNILDKHELAARSISLLAAAA